MHEVVGCCYRPSPSEALPRIHQERTHSGVQVGLQLGLLPQLDPKLDPHHHPPRLRLDSLGQERPSLVPRQRAHHENVLRRRARARHPQHARAGAPRTRREGRFQKREAGGTDSPFPRYGRCAFCRGGRRRRVGRRDVQVEVGDGGAEAVLHAVASSLGTEGGRGMGGSVGQKSGGEEDDGSGSLRWRILCGAKG